MLVVTGHFRLPPDRLQTGRTMMERVIFASRAEEGCITYAYSEDVLEPGLFRVTEIWTGRAALDAHFQTEHMQLWQQERAQLGMTDRQITAITVKDSEAL